jgi:pilus assembly protein CpaF
MLNALSKMIDPGERVITIEDAAELRLQQPHWLPLETRPPNLEGQGAITIRDLVINALRMRPDRIILGEIRGQECFDLLAAMNTGHDGSMATLHSNSPRECLARMENMVMMGNITEVIGMEGEVIVTQELFKFEYLDETADGKIIGEYRSMGLRPYTLDKAKQYGFDQPYLEACL